MASGWRYAAAIALAVGVAFPAAADGHREAVLRLVSISSALRDQARSHQDNGMLGLDVQARMAAFECAELLQDVVSMRNVQALRAAASGDLAVKWHGKRELLLRMQRGPVFGLEVHDSAGAACTVTRGQDKLTPVLLDLPGMKQGPPQIFAVDPVRSPSREPLE